MLGGIVFLSYTYAWKVRGDTSLILKDKDILTSSASRSDRVECLFGSKRWMMMYINGRNTYYCRFSLHRCIIVFRAPLLFLIGIFACP